jgi:hypothetical protein
MLARTLSIRHPLGGTIKTPLLVPSFSSKGFGFAGEGKSEIGDIYQLATEYLTDSMLVSAYDIHYGHIPCIDEPITEVTFVDSGGYETKSEHDLSAIFRHPSHASEWSEDHLRSVLDQWKDYVPAVFINYDEQDVKASLEDQIQRAQGLFRKYPRQWHELLIKPQVDVDGMVSKAQVLAAFNVVGVTEKELGNTMLKRMTNLARIRLAFDDLRLQVPIHVFGSLDPVGTVLYYMAGADIFDGLTWLRYGYRGGIASYVHNYGVIEVGIDKHESQVKSRMLADNLYYLSDLKHQLTVFAMDQDFGKLDFHSDFFRRSYDRLRTQIERLR